MRFKCPKCETDMDLQENAHVCPECSHEVTLDEATELFDAGKLIGIVNEEEAEHIVEETEDKVIVTDLSEDIAALVEGEELSEAFVEKAKVIFEAAVTSRVEEQMAISEEKVKEYVNYVKEETEKEMIEKVDGYLDHVVSEWMTENELAIETGIKAEMNEAFAEGISDLLKEHFIQAPEDRWDIVEGLADKVESLEAKLDEEMEKGMKSAKAVLEAEKTVAFVELAEGLADTQAEKLKGLAESVEAESVEEYVSKVTTLKESYFKAAPTETEKEITESDDTDDEEDSSSLQEAIRLLNRKA